MMKKLALLTLIPMTFTLQGAFAMKKGQPLEKLEVETVIQAQMQTDSQTQVIIKPQNIPGTTNAEQPIVLNTPKIPIWIIGDSTVSNFPDNETFKGKGWGQLLHEFVKYPEMVRNRAMPGTSSKSFKPKDKWHPERSWYGVKRELEKEKKGFLLIQFGHNDGSNYGKNNGKGTSPEQFYKELVEYIEVAKKNNVLAVLITSVSRFAKGKTNQHGEYSNMMRRLGKDKGIFVLDLEKASQEEYDKYKTSQEVKNFYSWDKKDPTHFSEQGAKSIVELINHLACEYKNIICNQFKVR